MLYLYTLEIPIIKVMVYYTLHFKVTKKCNIKNGGIKDVVSACAYE